MDDWMFMVEGWEGCGLTDVKTQLRCTHTYHICIYDMRYVLYTYVYIYNVATPNNGDEQSYYHPPNKIDPENHYLLEECSLPTPNLAGSMLVW